MPTPTNLLQAQVETLELAGRHWETKRRHKAAKRGFTIALGREAGAPGTSVASEVGKRLGWPVFDNQLVERIAQELGLRTQLLESVDEKRRSWLLEAVEGFASGRGISEMTYVRHLTQTILSLGSHGECVIVGRGAAHILPQESTLRVRLIGDLEDRISAIGQRLNLSREKASKWVADTDHERQRFVRDHFLKDPTDPRQYDLILNTSTWSISDCADLIVYALKEFEHRKNAGMGENTPPTPPS